jgi:hypothetical protein
MHVLMYVKHCISILLSLIFQDILLSLCEGIVCCPIYWFHITIFNYLPYILTLEQRLHGQGTHLAILSCKICRFLVEVIFLFST